MYAVISVQNKISDFKQNGVVKITRWTTTGFLQKCLLTTNSFKIRCLEQLTIANVSFILFLEVIFRNLLFVLKYSATVLIMFDKN